MSSPSAVKAALVEIIDGRAKANISLVHAFHSERRELQSRFHAARRAARHVARGSEDPAGKELKDAMIGAHIRMSIHEDKDKPQDAIAFVSSELLLCEGLEALVPDLAKHIRPRPRGPPTIIDLVDFMLRSRHNCRVILAALERMV